ncbi:MAG: hypothetical protein JXX29_11090 [Deltaproteobacteria bacterium]|nr:hypothetical protein [Deltaproteobacteria bacterium]MBN2672215.1 hypothetical protein [Deltaproteobacteria bacterium]
MKQSKHVIRAWMVLGFTATLLMAAQSAMALDAAYSRKGPFTGIGFGGGGAVIMNEDTAGAGDLALNLQLGLGASEKLTVSLNLDNRLQIGNDLAQGMIVPGPRFAIFLSKNLYISAGVGLALAISAEPNNDNAVGMDAGLSVGYEHFVNTNIAAYISGGVEYFLLNEASDTMVFMLGLGIRYY